jgi:hypothetical protein
MYVYIYIYIYIYLAINEIKTRIKLVFITKIYF